MLLLLNRVVRAKGYTNYAVALSATMICEAIRAASLRRLKRLISSSDDILIFNGFIHNVTCSSIKMMFFSQECLRSVPFFARMQCLSLTGGHLVQDESIVNLAALCPPIRHLRICGFDRSFTMRGPPFPPPTSSVCYIVVSNVY